MAVAGLFLLVAGTLPLMTDSDNTPSIYNSAIYTVRMFGNSMVTMPDSTAGMNALHTHHLHHGTAVKHTIRTVAAYIGTAILVSVLSVDYKGATPSECGKVLDPIEDSHAMHTDTLAGYRAAFAVSLDLAALGLVLSFFLNNDAMDRRHPT